MTKCSSLPSEAQEPVRVAACLLQPRAEEEPARVAACLAQPQAEVAVSLEGAVAPVEALRPQGQTCLVVHLQAKTRVASLVEGVEVAERQAPEGSLVVEAAAAVQGAVSLVLPQAAQQPQVEPAVSSVLELEELTPEVGAFSEHQAEEPALVEACLVQPQAEEPSPVAACLVQPQVEEPAPVAACLVQPQPEEPAPAAACLVQPQAEEPAPAAACLVQPQAEEGASSGSSLFGAAPSGGASSSGSLFGAAPSGGANSGGSLFGAAASGGGNLFGATAGQSGGTNLFGAGSASTSAFGAGSAGVAFGASSGGSELQQARATVVEHRKVSDLLRMWEERIHKQAQHFDAFAEQVLRFDTDLIANAAKVKVLREEHAQLKGRQELVDRSLQQIWEQQDSLGRLLSGLVEALWPQPQQADEAAGSAAAPIRSHQRALALTLQLDELERQAEDLARETGKIQSNLYKEPLTTVVRVLDAHASALDTMSTQVTAVTQRIQVIEGSCRDAGTSSCRGAIVGRFVGRSLLDRKADPI
eukprot:s3203_g7.t1